MKNIIIRQGDVLIVKVDSIPKDVTPHKRDGGRIILAYGETSGHAHAIEDNHAKSWLHGKDIYLDLEKKTKLWHEDHNPKKDNKPAILEPGIYRVIHQSEFRRKAIVRVAD